MIKLTGAGGSGGSSLQTFTSSTFTIGSLGYTGVQLVTINHNLGAIPDLVQILFTGDTVQGNSYYAPSGPYGQVQDMDYGFNNSAGEVSYGAGCNFKSTTQVKCVFTYGRQGYKYYVKCTVFGGTHQAS